MHVTSFGKRGSNEGDLINPGGVCVDKDGFVYVMIEFKYFHFIILVCSFALFLLHVIFNIQ